MKKQSKDIEIKLDKRQKAYIKELYLMNKKLNNYQTTRFQGWETVNSESKYNFSQQLVLALEKKGLVRRDPSSEGAGAFALTSIGVDYAKSLVGSK